MSLNPKQAAFVLEYLKDLNATQAAIRAGYSPKSAASQAANLLKLPKVKDELALRMAGRAARVQVDADDILRELLRLARVDIGEAFTEGGALKPLHEMPEDVRRCIAGIEVEDVWDGDSQSGRFKCGELRKVKFWPKVQCLELLGKHLGLFRERVEVEGKLSLEQLVLESLGDKKAP